MKLKQNHNLIAIVFYSIIACVLTFPLIFKLNSTVYGGYDHATTDLFAAIYYSCWWIPYSIYELGSSPFITNMFTAPFGSEVGFINGTGFVVFPIVRLLGTLCTYNLLVLSNLVLSGFGMFCLVKYLTKSSKAGFIAGIVYAFCPNMMVRSYTTFDTTQIQWIPFYTLYLLKFLDNRTWKNAILTGVFLCCNIMFAIPYYLVYLPIHTTIIGLTYMYFDYKHHSKLDFKGFSKLAVSLLGVLVVFLVYYNVFVGGGAYSETRKRTTDQLKELALKPMDYLVPHPRSTFLGNATTRRDIKESYSYWDTTRKGKDPDSFVAYIGYIALMLAILGTIKHRHSKYVWMFLIGFIFALWATLGVVSPSGLIHKYAPFARRILIYKVFVQFSIAGLVGFGYAFLEKKEKSIKLLIVCCALIIAEYAIIPPALSVDLTETPEIYKQVKLLPENSIIIELPMVRANGNIYQGYRYYQMYHKKRLFNPYFGLSKVPENIRSFYKLMENSQQAERYEVLLALRSLGVTHIVYHYYIRTKTVQFAPPVRSLGLEKGTVEGLKAIYVNKLHPINDQFKSPYDYTFAILYEITAENKGE